MNTEWVAKDILTIEGFFSPDDCESHIGSSETSGFEEAQVSTASGDRMIKDLRNNDRVIVDDPTLAADLWARLEPCAPSLVRDDWQPVGLNERLRFYRYDVGQQFDWHRDGAYERKNGERSLFTFMVYLNGGFGGGETSFSTMKLPAPWANLKVKPEAGMALLFRHPIIHKGETVTTGRKYVLRTDVMFSRGERSDRPD